jgi:hypothetical protein
MNKKLNNDIDTFLDKYPIFSVIEKTEVFVCLEGKIDIIDIHGNYWDSYEIRIKVPITKYPNIIPEVYETSTKIKRENDWHISTDGTCCLDITHQLILLKNKGIDLISFYQNKIYPFFANHQYKLKKGNYANGDYPHEFEGIQYFYAESLKLTDTDLIIKILKQIITKRLPKKEAVCLCGQSKFKHCHLPTVTKLILFGQQQLKLDLLLFESNTTKLS